MTKRDTLLELLRRYREAECTLLTSGHGSGGNPTLMPKTWNHSFRELERCLNAMSGERPKQLRQVMARYVDPAICRRKLVGRRTAKGDVMFVNLPHHAEVRSYAQLPDRGHANEWDVVLASWPAWVEPKRVDAGVAWLERSFRGEPFLPREMLSDNMPAAA